jgi:regulator of replication initiation timing
MSVFRKGLPDFKSSLYEFARSVLRSRDTLRQKTEQLQEAKKQLQVENQDLERRLKAAQERAEQQAQLCRSYQEEIQELKAKPIRLPADLPPRNHTYGAGLIALCLNLAQRIGFRPASAALKIVFDYLRIEAKVPDHDSIRSWLQRVGIAEMNKACNEDDMIWFSDHSSQLGNEKVLTILGISANDLPEDRALQLADLRVLTVAPGTKWKKEDVARVYTSTALRQGVPRDVVCDGASELRDPAQNLEKDGKTPNVIGDMKHRAANLLEKIVGRNERFVEFQKQVGLTRNRVQQTELSHFAPPPLKVKSRFMNLGRLWRWATMVCGHLDHPQSKARQGITAERMTEKLGWVSEFREDLASWNRCQELINATLKFVNKEGVYRGAAKRLKALLAKTARAWPTRCEASQAMMKGLIEHAVQSESGLTKGGERGWGSTEILESLYGRYKRLEGQHSKGGFTGLLAALPALTVHWTAARVREALENVSVQDMNDWLTANLGQTLTSRRAEAYQEVASGFG